MIVNDVIMPAATCRAIGRAGMLLKCLRIRNKYPALAMPLSKTKTSFAVPDRRGDAYGSIIKMSRLQLWHMSNLPWRARGVYNAAAIIARHVPAPSCM